VKGGRERVLRRAWLASLYEIADHVATISQPHRKLRYGISVARRAGRGAEAGRFCPALTETGTVLMGCIGFTFVLLVEEPRTNTIQRYSGLNVGLLMLSHFGKIEMQQLY
jgi:hypothetical protein